MKVATWIVFLGTLLAFGHSHGQEPLLPQSGKSLPMTAFAKVTPDGTVTLKLMEVEKNKVKKLCLRPVYEGQIHSTSKISYRTMRLVFEESEVEVCSLVPKKLVSFPLSVVFKGNKDALIYGVTSIGNVSMSNLPDEIVKAAKDSGFQCTISDAKGHPVTQEKVMKMLSKEVPVLVSSEPVEELHLLTVKEDTLVFVLPNSTAEKPLASPYPARPEVSKITPIPQTQKP